MRNASILAATFAFGAATLAMTRDAHALGPVNLEIGAKAGLATNPSSDFPTNPLGFGLGGRAGISFLGIYGGVQFLYYFGGSDASSVLGNVSAHTWMYGFEGGYGFTFGPITIRPQIGLGNTTIHTTVKSTIGDISASAGDNNNFYFEPGVTGLFSFGLWFVGADANLLLIPGLDNSQAAFSLHGQIGIKL